MSCEAQDKVRLSVGLLLIWIQFKNNDNESHTTLKLSFAGLAVCPGHIWLNGKPGGSYRGHHWGGSKMNKWAQLLWSEVKNIFIYLPSLYLVFNEELLLWRKNKFLQGYEQSKNGN